MSWDTIFRTGTHTSSNGATRSWTEGELDLLVKNTGDDAPIVIRHPRDQAKAVNFGKIARLRRIGGLLQAQYADVPEILSTAVKEGLKLAKSVSIDPAKMIVRHVGLLGAGQDPAVEGLGSANFTVENGDDSLVTYTINQINFEKEDPMDPKDKEIQELKDKLKALETGKETDKRQAELDEANLALKTEKDAHEKTRQEYEKYKAGQVEKDLQTRVDALAESGRILPAEKDKVIGFAKAMADDKATMDFTAPDGKKETVTPRENYLRDLEARQPDSSGLLSEFAKRSPAGGGAYPGEDFKDINNFA